MIVVKLQGGLGNQMFQYALGLSLSTTHDVPLALDQTYLRSANQSNRDFRLFSFAITAPEATQKEISVYTSVGEKIIDRFRKLSNKKRIVEKTPAFDLSILSKKSGYFDGYWQSEQYFRSYKNLVKNEFSLRNPLGKEASIVRTTVLSQSNPISVHIRRGDYVIIEKIANIHGILPISYYEAACDMALKKFPDATFFISSDDIEWAMKHFPKKYNPTFISSPNIPDYEELTIMSMCKHNIIANSTFSWWGAWLNGNNDKIVIAPKYWFKDGAKEAKDLIPPSWIQI